MSSIANDNMGRAARIGKAFVENSLYKGYNRTVFSATCIVGLKVLLVNAEKIELKPTTL